MRFSFLIIDDSTTAAKGILDFFENFPNYFCVGVVKDNQTAVNQIIKLKPQLVIACISMKPNERGAFFTTINELFQYIDPMPYFIALAEVPDNALHAIQSGFSDYIMTPLNLHELGKSLFKFEKRMVSW